MCNNVLIGLESRCIRRGQITLTLLQTQSDYAQQQQIANWEGRVVSMTVVDCVYKLWELKRHFGLILTLTK